MPSLVEAGGYDIKDWEVQIFKVDRRDRVDVPEAQREALLGEVREFGHVILQAVSLDEAEFRDRIFPVS